jgi:hypothetical protein
MKVWCKLLSHDYHPVINLCSCAIVAFSSVETTEDKIIFRESEFFDPNYHMTLDSDMDEVRQVLFNPLRERDRIFKDNFFGFCTDFCLNHKE